MAVPRTDRPPIGYIYIYQMAPGVVTWSDLAKHCPWSKGQLIGNGIYCAPWHSASSYSRSGRSCS